ncbi:MAG TPA: hypothetical protein VFW09_04820 [Solirubrobacteraceae bacterium]|nr:hypothetical protein [Solirubrobacteraceae bacterium]
MTAPRRPTSTLAALVRRVRAFFGELDYAQRRLLELQTGHMLTDETRARHTQTEIRELEQLLDAEAHEHTLHSARRPA